ncbi:hypothetical protein CURE108131_05240 [Cupriavidus respiraculi]|uniref:Type II secretion system protein n=1 Tax=Cupriavidus respiraculi TaxID=195930 RepID=A0ABM8XCZ1_9BURK|nr:hypothetical protein [Cupriavidus respiraculi]CAG9177959.1 hypothetical protein LMG21510_03445 [Cupriavidus respiraculi]
MSATPCAPARRSRAEAHRFRPRSHARGYLLTEVLCALAVLGVGLLSLGGAAVVALPWLREQAVLAQAMRVAAEAAEQHPWRATAPSSPPAPLASLASRSVAAGLIGSPRLCAAALAGPAAGGCVPGSRLSVVHLLARSAAPTETAPRDLRAIALWLAP